ncbi:MAG: N-acetyltransferase [Deltaproteobacteria bacterium]|nr:N-acetyltransferase [Deltaproteobacteria bacterium]
MYQCRPGKPSDFSSVNALAVSAFEQYRDSFHDWAGFRSKISRMSDLVSGGELIVVDVNDCVVGAVVYCGPESLKAEYFESGWAIMRMLVVSPKWRGLGIGRSLAEDCISRAIRDDAEVFALHTCELMAAALTLYKRMGFVWEKDAPIIHGVKYGVYKKLLAQ